MVCEKRCRQPAKITRILNKVWKEHFLKGMLSGALMYVGVKPLYFEEICGFQGQIPMGYYCFLPGVHVVSAFLGISTPPF